VVVLLDDAAYERQLTRVVILRCDGQEQGVGVMARVDAGVVVIGVVYVCGLVQKQKIFRRLYCCNYEVSKT
jgi:hypothetical protein